MMPMLTIAFALLSGAADIARVFQSPEPAHAPVTFYFQNRHEEQTFVLQDDTGLVKTDVIKAFSYFVRCWRTEKVKPMHARTLEIVAAISHHFGNAKVEIVSGYRAKPYGAPHSKHFLGRAMDIHVVGVPARQVAAFVWKNFRNVGVGYYPKQEFVHVDTRDLDVRWVDSSAHGESAHAKYFGRLPTDLLPSDAPRLAYDIQKSGAPAGTAVASALPREINPALALSTIQGILDPSTVR
jgi:uncharacterized protein YcbK (DUF882 family)